MSEEGANKLVESLEAEKKELLERLSYAVAELDNMRKAWDKEIKRAEAAAIERIMRKLLVVYEDFERIVKRTASSELQPATSEALNMLLKQFEKILVSEGVERMDVVGKEFNPFEHEVAEAFESDDVKVDTIVEVVSNGYRLHDKILKPPKVKVAKPKKSGT